MSTPTEDKEIDEELDRIEEEELKSASHLCQGKLYSRREFCPRHGGFHICRGVMYDDKKDCPRCSKERNETSWRSVWWWTTFEIPKKQPTRGDFFALIVFILIAEVTLGPIIGAVLRSIFGWPF